MPKDQNVKSDANHSNYVSSIWRKKKYICAPTNDLLLNAHSLFTKNAKWWWMENGDSFSTINKWNMFVCIAEYLVKPALEYCINGKDQ